MIEQQQNWLRAPKVGNRVPGAELIILEFPLQNPLGFLVAPVPISEVLIRTLRKVGIERTFLMLETGWCTACNANVKFALEPSIRGNK